MKWHDYFSFTIHEFPIILIRKYNLNVWEEKSTIWLIQILSKLLVFRRDAENGYVSLYLKVLGFKIIERMPQNEKWF